MLHASARDVGRSRRSGHALAVAAAWLLAAPAATPAFTLEVVDGGGRPVTGFRWLVEEDATAFATPGETAPAEASAGFHRSYMPVVARGDSSRTDVAVDPSRRYFVSVLPDSGFTLGGAPVAPGQQAVRVVVSPHPIPTAQITVYAFEDLFPINNAPDLPEERGLAGFEVVLEDPGGRYGHVGGQVTMDAFGNPLGTIRTGPDGQVTIRNLSPGKYGVRLVAPPGQGWQQTSTIEGTRVVDAWVKPGEPPFFQEFGPPGWHVATGFVRPFRDPALAGGASTVTGRIVNLRLARPPDATFSAGEPFDHATCWVGLNSGVAGAGRGLLAQRCGPGNTFTIPGVPPGDYQLVVWDENLDQIFAFLGLTVPAGGAPVALGDVPVFTWFSRLHQYVFDDENENGIWEPELGEVGLPDVPTNIRFRDGTVYQSYPTDMDGFAPYDEVFPFFAWLVAEVDFARFKATGATVVVDAGGPVDAADPWSFGGLLAPQPQPENGGLPYRVDNGPVLLQGFQGFLGQTNVIQWGKKAYAPGENGGISGIVYYAVTRAEDDPAWAAAEPWEPGIPRVQVNLYADADGDGTADDRDGDGQVTPADVDHAPPGWESDPAAMGPEDVDRDGDGAFDLGDALRVTHTDSWDDAVPTGCPGDPEDPFFLSGRCYDGMRNWNQVRPAVFDGGYAFGSPEDPLPPGVYVVEVVPPRSRHSGAFGPAYEIVKEEDKNVDFGDAYEVSAASVPFACVGDLHVVPETLSLFPGQGIPAPFAGQPRPLCDRKQVWLTDGLNAAADFFMFTPVPVAGHIVGFVLDDTANEFDPASPQFGEKYAPPWLPVSIRDWTGREISRVHTDRFGQYSALVPSTFTMDRPAPTGVAPNMVTVCLNDPARPDPASPGGFVRDPWFNPQYSQFCYTFQYTPGTTTYLDTPVIRLAAFAGPGQVTVDCEPGSGTPRIHSVSGPSGSGPYVSGAGQQLTIVSQGEVLVPNPAYDPARDPPSLARVARDHGFGAVTGTVRIGAVPLPVVSWDAGLIVATVPAGAVTGQLTVTRGDTGESTVTGVTVTVGRTQALSVLPGRTIQETVDAAPPGALVLVPPGRYAEPVILWKPLRLQGWGEGSTVIDAIKAPAEKLLAWRQRAEAIVTGADPRCAGRCVDLLPGQELAFGGVEPGTLFNEEGAGVLVLAKNATPAGGGFGLVNGRPNARIDGFTITGADHSGGIVVNGYARYLEISNNRIVGNGGVYGGGVRVGHPLETGIETAFNDHLSIHSNQVVQNGALAGAGGGVSLYAGSDAYSVRANVVCGNFTLGEGAGIGHQGRSDGGLIERNAVIFNQSFNQGVTVSGGGILVSGEAVAPPALSPGSGSVLILGNLVQGNQAGAGDGGGVRVSRANGADVAAFPDQPARWYRVDLLNNVIANNVAALAGGGVSLQDAAVVTLFQNTVAHNDSTATAGAAFAPGSPDLSTDQPAGIVGRPHSPELSAAFARVSTTAPYREISNPTLNGNIVWRNRSFHFEADALAVPATFELRPRAASPYWDLDPAPAGSVTPRTLDPRWCLLTDVAGTHGSNRSGPPAFVAEYFNGGRGALVRPEVTTGIQPIPALDEGGNFIDLQFGPLSLWDPATGALLGDYHVLPGSAAVAGSGGAAALLRRYPQAAVDHDLEPRPQPAGTRPDIGADEIP